MSKRAILSVYDKSALSTLGRGLADLGWELVASGGTATALRQTGLAVRDVAEITAAPEMLGGRVKTLHPTVYAGILAQDRPQDWADLAAQHIAPVDLVVCNLYPFQQTVAQPGVTLAEAVEQIDIGGVTLLRAAAKNFARVAVVCDPADYAAVLAALAAGEVPPALRQQLALKAFRHTRDYDTAISAYLDQLQAAETAVLPSHITLALTQVQALRYGENPHQAAALYATDPQAGPLNGRLLQGKPLSYNNLLDLDAAWHAAESFAQPAVIIVKHLSPCGVAVGSTVAAAFPAALASDPISAFGGVIAVNRLADMALMTALETASLFVEAVIAPDFTPNALAWFAVHKKNCRLVQPAIGQKTPWELRSIRGGVLVQEVDSGDPPNVVYQVVSERQPTQEEWAALRFGWTACRHVKSNAIVLALETATVGIGGGLPSRVDAVRLALLKAGEKARGAIMASDAFFPFADGLEAAAAAGVTAVIEPGGSVRDDEVVAAADRWGLALVFTGARHFRH